MKRLFTFFCCSLFYFASAQNSQLSSGGEIPAPLPLNIFKKEIIQTRATTFSQWINYGRTISQVSTNMKYFVNYLFPDTTVRVHFSNGMGGVWKHSLGQMLDPTAPMFNITDTAITAWTAFSVDSISIPYLYFRYQPFPDTLRIQTFRKVNMFLVDSSGWPGNPSFGTVAYDTIRHCGKNFTAEINRVLTEDDTSQHQTDTLYIPINQPLNKGEKFAVVFTYLPGNGHNDGDTIDVTLTRLHAIDAFIYFEYRDDDKLIEQHHYKMGLAATKEIRYNTDTSGWKGAFLPGVAWADGIFHGDVNFRITFNLEQLSVETLSTGEKVSVYPNPVSDHITINNLHDVTAFNICDVTGRIIRTVKAYIGMNEIDVEDLSSGSYLLQLISANNIEAIQFIK